MTRLLGLVCAVSLCNLRLLQSIGLNGDPKDPNGPCWPVGVCIFWKVTHLAKNALVMGKYDPSSWGPANNFGR